MNRLKFKLSYLFILMMFLAAATHGIAQPPGNFMFLSPEEASSLRMTDEDLWEIRAEHQKEAERMLTRAMPVNVIKGPQIIIQTPEVSESTDVPTIVANSPTNLMIEFKESVNPVDMESLSVVVKKGFFSVRLTSRLQPFIKENAIRAKNIEIPEGKFYIEVSITDQKGIETSEEYVLRVEDN